MSLDGIRIAESYPNTTGVSSISVGIDVSDNMKRVANDTSSMINSSPEILRNKIENHELLNDVFFVNERGEIEVITASESKILSNHFKGLPVVPGVILRTLFETISGNSKLSSKSEFKGMVIPGNRLKITETGIENTGNNKEIFACSTGELNPAEIELPDSENYELLSKEDADRLILQSGSFRFVDEVRVFRNDTSTKSIEVGSVISGSFLVPERFEFLDKNGLVQKNIYDEIAAQILSLGASYILNGEFSSDDRKFKILTFGESNIRSISGENILPGSKIECIAKVTSATPKGAIVQFKLYSNGKEVLFGEIKGNIIPKALLSRTQR